MARRVEPGRDGPVDHAECRAAPTGRGPVSSMPPSPPTSGRWSPRMLGAGATIVGGCCGTTPEHIAAMRTAIDAIASTRPAGPAPEPRARRRRPSTPRSSGPTPTRRPCRRRARADGRRAAAADPAGRPPWPTVGSSSRSRSTRRARSGSSGRSRRRALLQAAGVDLVNISDSAMARVRMGAHGGRVRHPARPRPRVPRPLHDPRPEPHGARVGAARRPCPRRPQHPRPDRRPAADRRLPDRDGRLGRRFDRPDRDPRPAQPRRGPAGSPIGQPAGFTIACALDPTAADLRPRWIASNASSTPAPICHDPAALRRRPGRGDGRGGRAAGSGRAASRSRSCSGVLPLQSARHAEFLHHEVPGHHDPRRGPRGDGRGRRARRRGRPRDGPGAPGKIRALVAGHLHHAQLRPLRAGRRARPSDRAERAVRPAR